MKTFTIKHIRIAALVIFSLAALAAGIVMLIPKPAPYRPSVTPNDWMSLQRTYPYGRINPEAFQSAVQQARELISQGEVRSTPWEFTGPTNIGGRITDIEIPAGEPETMYIGAATGGILKTTDGGETWVNLFQEVPVVSIGDIAIDPANADILYAGTGEANSSSFSFWGNGMYKSIDAGATWEHIGLPYSAYIGRVIVDHGNSQRIFVAACGYLFSYNDQRGVYRSDDGGTTWERLLYLTDSTAAIDLIQHPVNDQILYAAMWERTRGLEYRNSFGTTSGIWQSVDGGDTWTELTNGLPTTNAGRIGLTISQSNPDILYAFYDLPDYEVGVFKTTNGGQSWTRTNDGDLFGMNSNFGWYFGQIRVDPSNPDRVFVMGVQLFKTENGGNSWTDAPSYTVHVDHHAMVIDENTGKITLGNDGGLYTSQNTGLIFSKINNLPITQFYAIDIDFQRPERIYGGTQDNNTIRTLTGDLDDWDAILGGDGMYTLVDYTNSNVIYAEYQWGNLYRSDDGGNNMNYIGQSWENERKNWSAPLAMHPEHPATLYFGTYRVWKSENKGNSWLPVSEDLTQGIDQYFHSITTITISPLDPAIVLVGAGDGKAHVSVNNGLSWTDISNGLPNRWITRIMPDPFDVQTIYATLSGFRWDEPLPHVYKSTNLGQSWASITGNLPEFPVNDLILDPDIPGKIIVATDAGMYGTIDGGYTWQWIWTDLPAVPIYALKVHVPTRTLVAGTYGLSTYSVNLDEIMTGTAMAGKPIARALTIHPNPVTLASSIVFTLAEEESFQILLTSLDGRNHANLHPGKPVNGQKGKNLIPLSSCIDTEHLPAGIYMIRLTGSKNQLTGKIVKEAR